MVIIRCYLANAPGFSDIELLISYFSIQFETDGIFILSAQVTSMNQADMISERIAGSLFFYITKNNSTSLLASAPLQAIRFDEGGTNKSITLNAMTG